MKQLMQRPVRVNRVGSFAWLSCGGYQRDEKDEFVKNAV